MPSFTLTDVKHDLCEERFSLSAKDVEKNSTAAWSVTKRTLRGGRRAGVDLIEVDNGVLAFSIVPTRGMGLWQAHYRDLFVGWHSPVTDGPVNPSFVNLMNWGGLGWLEGFDELLARCGLENNGAPYVEGGATFGLHGKIANIPAHYVAVHVGEGPGGAIAVEGHVDETKLFSTQIRMVTTISTKPGSNALTVSDEFRNLGDSSQEMQILYHWNFGQPFLEEGARFAAPAKTVVPRNARAVAGLDRFELYQAPEPGFAEQVYFFELIGAKENDRTLAMLRDHAGEKAVVLRFHRSQLPAFTLWKNTGGLKSGYVTGLEPGTNYPNPKPVERERGRVVMLPPGESYVTETTLEVLADRFDVARVEAEIASLQKQATRVIHRAPIESFTTV
jgi:Domain of unknown function (DUF4432)